MVAPAKNHGIDTAEYERLIQIGQLTEAELEKIRIAGQSARLFADGTIAKASLDVSFTSQNVCIIDWLNFTFNESTFYWAQTPNDVVYYTSDHLKYMLGYGVTEQRPNGAYLYERSYTLGENYGLLCHGGQRGSVLVSINSSGLLHASSRFCQLAKAFIEEANNSRITRIDLAHDDFNGEVYNIDSCLASYDSGGFSNGNRPPTLGQAGNWLQPDGSGRTVYIGKRSNGLFFRGYEKGKQLKSEEYPNWFRCEVEIKSTDRIIPPEILTFPHLYFAGSYPIFNNHAENLKRIDTFHHEISSDVEHRERWARRQLGNFLNLCLKRGDTPDQIISRLVKDDLPKKFKQKFIPPQTASADIRAYVEAYFSGTNNERTT